jgi:UDP-3-O-[3-hydroxymyristoyl] glucosamine N-acyltransferase
MDTKIGQNPIIGENVSFGENVVVKANCVIEDNVKIGDNTLIDSNSIIRSDVVIGSNSVVGANCIIGEYQMDYILDRKYHKHELTIGDNAVIRSGSIIYSGSHIGNNFQTGHHVTIREQTEMGNNVSIGTLSDIQGHCKFGNYVRLHSNIFVPMLSQIDDCVWIFPCTVITNDPTPPSNYEVCCHIHSFAIIAANVTLLPGIEVKNDAVIGAGTVVTKDVNEYELVTGNPGKVRGDVRNIKNPVTGEIHYPWRYHFDRAMPWIGYGFDTWYHSLDDETKKVLFG